MYKATIADAGKGRSGVPLFLDAHGSLFLVFAPEMEADGDYVSRDTWTGSLMAGKVISQQELDGEWKAYFPEESAGLGETIFDSLVYWNQRKEDGIRFFSGIATYEKSFEWEETA